MADSGLRVFARVVAKPDKVEELRSLLIGLIEPTRREPGCRRYELLQNTAVPTDFLFVQEWEDDAAYEAHLRSEHLKKFMLEMRNLVTEIPDMGRFKEVG